MPSSASTRDQTLLSPISIPETTITRQEWVYRQLKEAILSGQFVPGRSVTLRGIAAMLDVSPTPVREALRRLVAERALEAHGNRRISVPQMTREKLADICAARVSLETLAAECALPAIDSKRLAHLWRLNEQVDEAVENRDLGAYLRRHREFHFTFYDVGRTSVLMPLIESVWLQFSPFMRLAIDHIGVDYLVDRHAEALHAVERHDIGALRFALEADVREGLGSLTEADWKSLETETD
ncbi:MAG: GntR family transcriptional regulator [Salinisphaera sp.]|jgi:DNA-binding GntR family transcriptional regulator|nr:GntR family transcriptional regulator [Salinisphaera sp.]